MLTYDNLPQEFKNNLKLNKTASVVFVKKDGTVRTMAFRKFLKAYDPI
jgi:hypothetical protein